MPDTITITSEQRVTAGVGVELRRNHHYNPGAEGATLPLDVVSGGSLVRRTVAEGTLPAAGSAYFELTASSTASAIVRTKQTERAPVVPGELWAGKLVGYNPIAATRTLLLILRFWSSPPGATAGVAIYSPAINVTIPASGAWSAELAGIAPAGAQSVGMEIQRSSGGGAAAGDRLLFDNLQLERLDAPGFLGGYFEGDRADTAEAIYSWAGTQYNSASVLNAPARPTTTPTLALELESTRQSRSTAADIIGLESSYVGLQPAGLRRGTHRFFYEIGGETQAETDSAEAEIMLSEGGIFTLTYPERPSMEMRFVVLGAVTRRIAEDRTCWYLDVDYLEVPA